MDKLENALEKARQQRQTELSGDAGHTPHATKSKNQTAEAFTASTKNSAPLFEEVLDKNKIVAHRPRSKEADVFRLLRTQILQTMNKAGLKTLAITSPNYGDGKTTLALNLAVSIALDLKQTVLLADLDLRKPCVHKYLDIDPKFGLTDYLSKRADLPECLVRLPFERLTTLPAGRTLDHSSETLGSPQMAALAHELKTRYPDRIVIYDMPPLLEQDDSLAFLPHVDAVLLVLKNFATKTDDIKRCTDILANANVIGTVLNTPSV